MNRYWYEKHVKCGKNKINYRKLSTYVKPFLPTVHTLNQILSTNKFFFLILNINICI